MANKPLMTRKRVLSFVLFMVPIALTILWTFYSPTAIWAFHIQSLGISWQAICTFVSFMVMAAWSFLDKKGVWKEK